LFLLKNNAVKVGGALGDCGKWGEMSIPTQNPPAALGSCAFKPNSKGWLIFSVVSGYDSYFVHVLNSFWLVCFKVMGA
jgi:hypothetical protein